MKVVKKIIYDGSPQQGESGLESKVKIIVGDDKETDPMFFAEINYLVVIPYTTPCKNIGEAVTNIKNFIDTQSGLFIDEKFNN